MTVDINLSRSGILNLDLILTATRIYSMLNVNIRSRRNLPYTCTFRLTIYVAHAHTFCLNSYEVDTVRDNSPVTLRSLRVENQKDREGEEAKERSCGGGKWMHVESGVVDFLSPYRHFCSLFLPS